MAGFRMMWKQKYYAKTKVNIKSKSMSKVLNSGNILIKIVLIKYVCNRLIVNVYVESVTFKSKTISFVDQAYRNIPQDFIMTFAIKMLIKVLLNAISISLSL